ncbi:tyrosine-type recombinase/integrase [Akkermansiaceae bacterium]|nr:tyrosine-type recombinase/integrase [Akkermansiaceae bacterium]MDB4764365.1 tyrosine-type recombinase/integrase [Akkermansiaceae bacterium]
MARPVKFEPQKNKKGKWQLNIPAGYSETGQRHQPTFKTRKDAEAAAKVYREKKASFGKQSKNIKPILAEAAARADEILKPFGITILEAAERVAKLERQAQKSVPMSEAVAAFLETKENLSVSTLRDYRHMEETLNNHFKGRILCEVSGQEIMEAAQSDTGTASTFNRRIDDTARFLKWAARKPREWVDVREIENFETKTHKKGKIAVLSPAEVENLLKTAEEHYPDTVVAFVLMVMMGIRPSEVEKMYAEDITEDGVVVPDEDEQTGEETKTGRRFIQMTPIVAEWLKEYPPSKKIAPPNWDRKYKAVRRLAGWGVVADLLGAEYKKISGLPKWHQDVLRHTAATIVINLGKPLTVLIFEHGHTQGEATLKKHYLGRMTKRQALSILAFGPKGNRLKPQTISAA